MKDRANTGFLNLWAKLRLHRWEIFLVVILLAVVGIAHGWNMFHYPYYESDEGTYMAQAWAVIQNGQLAPYTYWYDHAPGGWLLIALWLKLTGGVLAFGFSINSGRVLMLVLHLFSALLLYMIARHLTRSRAASTLTVLLFSLSPLAIYFQRRVLLDNIMVFWVLLSLWLLLRYGNRLRYILLSAIAMGFAVLSKENAIFFIPLGLLVIYWRAHSKHRNFAYFQWLGVTAMVISLYFFFALFKGELFPTGTLLGGDSSHVSLLGTLEFQGNRGAIPIWDSASSFWSVARRWVLDDPIIIFGGAFASLAVLIAGIRKRSALFVGLFAGLYWAFLLRGGLVLEFYIVPLIPVVALAMGYLANMIFIWLRGRRYLRRGLLQAVRYLPYAGAAVILYFMIFHFSMHFRQGQNIYTSDQTTAQKEAVEWILSQEHPNQFYVIDNYAYLDLKLRNDGNFSRADYYWKVDQDRDVRDEVLNADPNNIDYIAFTPLIGGDLGTGELPIVGTALDNSNPLKSFRGDGWYVQIWAVKNPDRVLDAGWTTYKNNFISSAGMVESGSSKAQADALQRAVWMNDKPTFNRVLRWTKANLGQADSLFASSKPTADVVVRTDSGADTDIAQALLLASRKWKAPYYDRQARAVMDGIWSNEVVDIGGRPYMSAGNWSSADAAALGSVTVRPAALAPAAYRIFAAADPTRPWDDLVATTYETLEQCLVLPNGEGGGVLPPEWCSLNTADAPAALSVVEGASSTIYTPAAGAVLQRIQLDYQWNKAPDAKNFIGRMSFLAEQYKASGKLVNAYTHDGKVWENYESASAYSNSLSYFSLFNPSAAKDVYNKQLLNKFYEDENKSYWEDDNSPSTQRSAWLGTALYNGSLKSDWPLPAVK